VCSPEEGPRTAQPCSAQIATSFMADKIPNRASGKEGASAALASFHRGFPMNDAIEIVVIYSSIDGCKIKRSFKRLAWARKFAHKWVGPFPEIGRSYAISGDGVDKIEAWGTPLSVLFPEPV
jgi:hypothetical protein